MRDLGGVKNAIFRQFGVGLSCGVWSAGSVEVQALGAAERALIAAQLTSLFEVSSTLREHLDGNETEKKELARELRELKTKIKK